MKCIMSAVLERDYEDLGEITEDILTMAFEGSSRIRGSVRMMASGYLLRSDIEARFRRAWIRGPLPKDKGVLFDMAFDSGSTRSKTVACLVELDHNHVTDNPGV
jgi:hypothetical protein